MSEQEEDSVEKFLQEFVNSNFIELDLTIAMTEEEFEIISNSVHYPRRMMGGAVVPQDNKFAAIASPSEGTDSLLSIALGLLKEYPTAVQTMATDTEYNIVVRPDKDYRKNQKATVTIEPLQSDKS